MCGSLFKRIAEKLNRRVNLAIAGNLAVLGPQQEDWAGHPGAVHAVGARARPRHPGWGHPRRSWAGLAERHGGHTPAAPPAAPALPELKTAK